MNDELTLTAAEELDQWERLANMPDCITAGRLVPEDVLAMVSRLRAAEAALRQIAGARVLGTPDEISRAQIEAMIDVAKQGFPKVECDHHFVFEPGSETKAVKCTKCSYALPPIQDPQSPIYRGPIAPGMRFIWEPNNPHERRVIEVAEVADTDGNGRCIVSFTPNGIYEPEYTDESSFRASVVVPSLSVGDDGAKLMPVIGWIA